jgi:hypothetical protein
MGNRVQTMNHGGEGLGGNADKWGLLLQRSGALQEASRPRLRRNVVRGRRLYKVPRALLTGTLEKTCGCVNAALNAGRLGNWHLKDGQLTVVRHVGKESVAMTCLDGLSCVYGPTPWYCVTWDAVEMQYC